MKTRKNHDRKSQLSMIHIAKKELGLDDDTYRSIVSLMSNGRTNSSGELDDGERSKLIDHFIGRGWKKQTHAKPEVDAARTPIMGKVGALLADMKLPWAYADGMAKKMFNKPKIQWCDHAQLSAIVTALVKLQESGKYASNR